MRREELMKAYFWKYFRDMHFTFVRFSSRRNTTFYNGAHVLLDSVDIRDKNAMNQLDLGDVKKVKSYKVHGHRFIPDGEGRFEFSKSVKRNPSQGWAQETVSCPAIFEFKDTRAKGLRKSRHVTQDLRYRVGFSEARGYSPYAMFRELESDYFSALGKYGVVFSVDLNHLVYGVTMREVELFSRYSKLGVLFMYSAWRWVGEGSTKGILRYIIDPLPSGWVYRLVFFVSRGQLFQTQWQDFSRFLELVGMSLDRLGSPPNYLRLFTPEKPVIPESDHSHVISSLGSIANRYWEEGVRNAIVELYIRIFTFWLGYTIDYSAVKIFDLYKELNETYGFHEFDGGIPRLEEVFDMVDYVFHNSQRMWGTPGKPLFEMYDQLPKGLVKDVYELLVPYSKVKG